MAKKLALSQSNLKRLRDTLRNAPLFALCGVVSISVEVFAWGGILNENHATVEISARPSVWLTPKWPLPLRFRCSLSCSPVRRLPAKQTLALASGDGQVGHSFWLYSC